MSLRLAPAHTRPVFVGGWITRPFPAWPPRRQPAWTRPGPAWGEVEEPGSTLTAPRDTLALCTSSDSFLLCFRTWAASEARLRQALHASCLSDGTRFGREQQLPNNPSGAQHEDLVLQRPHPRRRPRLCPTQGRTRAPLTGPVDIPPCPDPLMHTHVGRVPSHFVLPISTSPDIFQRRGNPSVLISVSYIYMPGCQI